MVEDPLTVNIGKSSYFQLNDMVRHFCGKASYFQINDMMRHFLIKKSIALMNGTPGEF